MTLPHLARPIIDSAGNRQGAATVRVLQPGTNPSSDLRVAFPVYSDALGTTAIGTSFAVVNGLIDFFIDTPHYVQLGVTVSPNPEEFYDWVPVNVPIAGYDNNPGSLTLMEGPILEVFNASGGVSTLALHAPSGQRFLIAVDNTGVLTCLPG